jgi:hypothetical protein
MGEEGARFYRGSVINEFGRRREGCLCVGRSRWVGQPGTTRLHEKRNTNLRGHTVVSQWNR